MYLEGSDQHRGWFQSSLLTSIGAYGIAPYKSVMHCGFTVDEDGRKMSKSLGNGVDPADVEKEYGAEILRMWVSSVDYSQDVSISDNILKRVSDSYRRFRNTFRFLLGNLYDFDDQKDAVAWENLLPIDQWALCRLAQLLDEVEQGYDAYRFHNVYRAVYEYIVGDLSAVYLDALKDRLYSEAPDSAARRSAQTVLLNILDVLVRVLSPILSFTTEEVWQNYPEALRTRAGREESVQLAGWPSVDTFTPAIPAGEAERIRAQFDLVLEARETVTKALEDARNADAIKKSQEAAVTLTAPQATVDALRALPEGTLEELFIIAGITVEAGDELAATVAVTDLDKCPRCWNHRALGGNANHPDVCERCGDALDAIGYEPVE